MLYDGWCVVTPGVTRIIGTITCGACWRTAWEGAFKMLCVQFHKQNFGV